MNVFLVLVYVTAALLELVGVSLLVLDVRESRRRWDGFQASLAGEEQAMAKDLRFRLDPMIARYGFTPAQIMRTIGTVETLVEVKRWRQNLAICLLVAGIALGLLGNLVGLGS